MSTNSAEPIRSVGDEKDLAEAREFPGSTTPSFYQRNSGLLPRVNAGMTDSHRRAKLPTPDNPESGSILEAIRSILRR